MGLGDGLAGVGCILLGTSTASSRSIRGTPDEGSNGADCTRWGRVDAGTDTVTVVGRGRLDVEDWLADWRDLDANVDEGNVDEEEEEAGVVEDEFASFPLDKVVLLRWLPAVVLWPVRDSIRDANSLKLIIY